MNIFDRKFKIKLELSERFYSKFLSSDQMNWKANIESFKEEQAGLLAEYEQEISLKLKNPLNRYTGRCFYEFCIFKPFVI